MGLSSPCCWGPFHKEVLFMLSIRNCGRVLKMCIYDSIEGGLHYNSHFRALFLRYWMKEDLTFIILSSSFLGKSNRSVNSCKTPIRSSSRVRAHPPLHLHRLSWSFYQWDDKINRWISEPRRTRPFTLEFTPLVRGSWFLSFYYHGCLDHLLPPDIEALWLRERLALHQKRHRNLDWSQWPECYQ